MDLLWGATSSVATDISASVFTIKSIIWSSTFSFTMGSWGPCVFEPQHPYSASSSASPKTANASYFPRLFWGHSFFQWPKPRYQAHWFGCRVVLGFLVGGLPGDQRWFRGGGGFGEGPGKGLPKAANNSILWSALLLPSLRFFSAFFFASTSLFLNTLLAISICELVMANTLHLTFGACAWYEGRLEIQSLCLSQFETKLPLNLLI